MSIVNIFELGTTDDVVEGHRVYTAGGMGTTLASFYLWATATPSFEVVFEDFSTKGFIFRDPADEERFLAEYAGWLDLFKH